MERWTLVSAMALVGFALALATLTADSADAQGDATPASVPDFPPAEGSPCPLLEKFPPFSQQANQPFTALIRAPSPDVPPAQAAFVGAWGVQAGDGSELRLVVFRVLSPDTRVALVGSDFRSEAFATPEVSGNVLKFTSAFGNVNTFHMLNDLNSIEMTREAPDGGKLVATLTRCSLS